MSKPVLDNSGTAKSAFKANLSKQGKFSLIITGWQAADKSFLSDVTELRLVVSSLRIACCHATSRRAVLKAATLVSRRLRVLFSLRTNTGPLSTLL